jgi:hypothetical protein
MAVIEIEEKSATAQWDSILTSVNVNPEFPANSPKRGARQVRRRVNEILDERRAAIEPTACRMTNAIPCAIDLPAVRFPLFSNYALPQCV